MKNKLLQITVLYIILGALYIILPQSVRASYVFPYPSFMPGNKAYKMMRIFDDVKRYWHFGNIAKVKYELGLSDKYLVEAKTLLEYNQFLLATDALARSDTHVRKIIQYVIAAENEGKEMKKMKEEIGEAMTQHGRVLSESKKRIPELFDWKPEKEEGKRLMLHERLDEAAALRQNIQKEVLQNP